MLNYEPRIHFLFIHIEGWSIREMLWIAGFVGMMMLAIVAGVVSLFTKY